MPTAKGSVPWNKGTGKGWVDKRGYRWLYVDENGKHRARREHRVVMEKHLGRRLEPWELVHHKDQDPSNNAIENLEVTTFGAHSTEHHSGSRRNYDTRRSMEAFALLREELKAERSIKADLLQALIDLQELAALLAANCTDRVDVSNDPRVGAARKAIAKATGEQPC